MGENEGKHPNIFKLDTTRDDGATRSISYSCLQEKSHSTVWGGDDESQQEWKSQLHGSLLF